ncbi:MAG TPA: DUF6468 domain-containing protein [Rhizomicrobium sp.]|jgi:hypothetical protein
MSIALFVEILLSALLLATVVYCALLERKLSALRKGQDGLAETIGELNRAIVSASVSMRTLRATADDAGKLLQEQIGKARGMIDELSLLNVSGERIAQRIVGGAQAKPSANTLPTALTNRLDALRPRAAGGMR